VPLRDSLGRRLRRQPPAYSPLSLGALAGAVLGARGDSRAELAALLRERFTAERVLLCGSGTQALQIAITAARALLGDASAAVALPAFSCFDVASAAVGAGGPVAAYDLDPETLSPDPASLERVVEAGARVVVAAAFYGHPVAWDQVEAVAARHGAVVIEDAAQGHGGAWRGRPLGSLGRLSVLSFGRGKGWTGGAGGALLLRGGDADLPGLAAASLPRGARIVAASAAQWALARPWLYALPNALPGLQLGETVYHPPADPVAMSPAAAALALRTRAASDAEAAVRRRNGAALVDALADSPSVALIRPVPDGEPGCLRLPVRLRGSIDEGRARALGVMRSYPHPLPRLPALAPRLSGPERRWPGAEELAAKLVTLPTHSHVTPGDRSAIVHFFDPALPGAPSSAPRPVPSLR
jgi:dTDP-4-amino-4,6-dideoxygalactose transaminase